MWGLSASARNGAPAAAPEMRSRPIGAAPHPRSRPITSNIDRVQYRTKLYKPICRPPHPSRAGYGACGCARDALWLLGRAGGRQGVYRGGHGDTHARDAAVTPPHGRGVPHPPHALLPAIRQGPPPCPPNPTPLTPHPPKPLPSTPAPPFAPNPVHPSTPGKAPVPLPYAPPRPRGIPRRPPLSPRRSPRGFLVPRLPPVTFSPQPHQVGPIRAGGDRAENRARGGAASRYSLLLVRGRLRA